MAGKVDPKINFKRDQGGGLLPDGPYRLRVEDVEVKQSASSEHPYLNVKLAVLHNGQPKGLPVWDVLSFSPAARFKFDQILDALNAPEDGQVSVRWLKGKQVWASLITQTYKGKVANKVGQYLTPEVAAQLLEDAGLADGDGDDEDEDDDLDEEDDDEDTDEEDEEEVAPVKPTAKVKAPATPAKKTATKPAAKKKPVVDDDEEDDEDTPF